MRVSRDRFGLYLSALDELENDEDFATAGTESRTEGLGDPYGIKTTEVGVWRVLGETTWWWWIAAFLLGL